MTAKRPIPGYRFELIHDVDRFPDFVAPKGMTGTVTTVQDNGLIAATMDQQLAGAEQWNNQIWWTSGLREFCKDTAPLIPQDDVPAPA